MTISISLGWWVVPALVTLAMFVGWRVYGVREQPQRGSMFPDFVGGLVEVGGYLVITLLAVIVWLIWGIAG